MGFPAKQFLPVESGKAHLAPKLLLLLVLAIATALRIWDLEAGSLENDEQVWHARSAHFVYDLFMPVMPDNVHLPKQYWTTPFVDLTYVTTWPVLKGYPFDIRMTAWHPGTPPALLIGISYFLFSDQASGFSLGIMSSIKAARLPIAFIGVLMVLMTWALGKELGGERLGLVAAAFVAVEPLLVGQSRVGRLDLPAAFFALSALTMFVRAAKRRSVPAATGAGVFSGLAVATNPFGMFIAVYALPCLFLLGKEDLLRFLPRALAAATLAAFASLVIAYPNLWPNPIVALGQWLQILFNTPHAQGLAPANYYPTTRLFFLFEAPKHLSPWLLAMAGLGAAFALKKRLKAGGILLAWLLLILAMHSLPPGYKEVKNVLLAVPVLSMLAALVILTIQERGFASLLCFVLFAGCLLTFYAWPYPRLYIWPWISDPQHASPPLEVIAEGEGIRDALYWVEARENSQVPVAILTGVNNAEYYYPIEKLGLPANLQELRSFKWLIVTPKSAFASPASHPIVSLVRNSEPDTILYNNNVELVRIFYVARLLEQ